LCAGDGYDVIVQAFAGKKRGGYGRVMVINPLHSQLPKLCVMVQVSDASYIWSIHIAVTILYAAGADNAAGCCTGINVYGISDAIVKFFSWTSQT
jgi:hypothetical protein